MQDNGTKKQDATTSSAIKPKRRFSKSASVLNHPIATSFNDILHCIR